MKKSKHLNIMVATKQTANGELEVFVLYSESCNHVYAKKRISLGGSQKTIRTLRKHIDGGLHSFFTTNWFTRYSAANAKLRRRNEENIYVSLKSWFIENGFTIRVEND